MSHERLYTADVKFRIREQHKRKLIQIAMRRDTDISDVGREAVRFYLEHPDSPGHRELEPQLEPADAL